MERSFDIIKNLIEPTSKIIDLGCGDGSLMSILTKKQIKCVGIDINNKKIEKCIHKGLLAINYDVDSDLKDYGKNSFDYSILNQTMQAVKNPVKVLNEATRISKKTIVGFPNFAHYSVRFGLLFKGKMPKSKNLPFEWYNTPNIHLFTIKDFKNICKQNNIKIIKEIYYNNYTYKYKKYKKDISFLPNLRAENAIFVVEKKN